MTTFEILRKIGQTSGRNDKIDIIKNNIQNDEFKNVLQFVFDGLIVTGISDKKWEKVSPSNTSQFNNLTEVLEYLKKNNTGKDENVSMVRSFESNLSSDDADIFKKIVCKSLSIGIDSSSVNTAVGYPMIKVFDVMLAESYDDNQERVIGKEFILSTKMDGLRLFAYKINNKIELYSRSGKKFEGLDDIENDLKCLPDGLYDGELLFNYNTNDSAALYRMTIKEANKKGFKSNLIFNVFDYIDDYESYISTKVCNTKCSDRKKFLHKVLNENKLKWIKEVEILYQGNDVNEIKPIFDKITRNGGEGLMLNIADAPYEGKRTRNILKIKKFNTADLRVIDTFEGKGKMVGSLGGIVVELTVKNNVYKVSVGSGFSDIERKYYWENKDEILGKIVEIRYFEVSNNEKGEYSLRFPGWLGIIRTDKNDVSTF